MIGQLETGKEFFVGSLQLKFFACSREYSCGPLLLGCISRKLFVPRARNCDAGEVGQELFKVGSTGLS